MGEQMPGKKHSFRAAFLTGLVAIALLGIGLFFGVRALVTGDREPEMLFPDNVDGVTGELLPSLDPNLGDIKAGGIGLFFGVRALVTGDREPEMLFPDNVDGVTGELLPSLDPNLGDIKAGDYVYDGLIALVAKHDLPVFQTADELPDEMLLSFALWGALRGESYQEEIVDRPDGTRFLPQEVVERSLADHFALTRTVPHQSVSVYTDFTYSAEEGGYTVWITGVETRYLPRVQEIRSEGNRYQVTLDYVDLVALGEGELSPGGYTVWITGVETRYLPRVQEIRSEGNRYQVTLDYVDLVALGEGELSPETPSAKRVLLTLEGGGREYKVLSLALLSEGAAG